jgi:hypothetical protein
MAMEGGSDNFEAAAVLNVVVLPTASGEFKSSFFEPGVLELEFQGFKLPALHFNLSD